MDLRRGTFRAGAEGDAFMGARLQGNAGELVFPREKEFCTSFKRNKKYKAQISVVLVLAPAVESVLVSALMEGRVQAARTESALSNLDSALMWELGNERYMSSEEELAFN